MTNRAGTGLPILSRLVEGERTPGLDADGHPDQVSRFVLPPLPLGLRPPSPEPRSLLLNAPKKRRFRTSSSDSNMFDFSCLNRLLSSYETTRVTRYGEELLQLYSPSVDHL
ncbi:hypothetical protein TELCIR_01755 [Teladorsagia circumcincta]|uniref:Uncharacterized protein n=1 Tax=Teladorsagia circumcincta TaxID=45464 RepID=A0A2G9V135_TELCI|nr:hypothetical protein TELCIR_01755 [Teladorsagia circumcincta]